ncbi:hypothetical protein D8674_005491 [Pyrus ussuriensis x Pyrus communis]|uniref:Uncharacterized protein n=1 Tax=Pyrus ussuriensis x Pyrus communis TaxID=2448454 RepID=A0A5N5G5A9_9ROSA|nr:hypothetical protein D8674_005491 [Pyrus ussuriensis x Pyrus communis]
MARGLLACFGSKGGSRTSHEKHAAGATAHVSAEEQQRSGPVLVELFSSQGCSTSPVAELLVSRLGRGDFDGTTCLLWWCWRSTWTTGTNGLEGPIWSSQWTVRQKAYVEALGLDTMFTPQIVLQGRAQCVGNDESALLVANATFQRSSPDSLQVSLTGSLRSKVDNYGVNVMVALYENGLITDCPKGENQGRVLSNDFVVRRLEKLCTVKDIAAKKTISGTINFSLWEGFNPAKCGMALFVQNPSHQIFGLQNFQLPDN